MEQPAGPFPFEVSFEEVEKNPAPYVEAIISSLTSEFLVLPKGAGFVEYPVFERGYEALKRATCSFTQMRPDTILQVSQRVPIAVCVLRTMLGFSPPEWAYVATDQTGIEVAQGYARSLDRAIRLAPFEPLSMTAHRAQRLHALIETACTLLTQGPTRTGEPTIHRLDKADTRSGLEGLQTTAELGVPYAMLLYERFLGRPFAAHRDSVSEMVGDALESAVEDVLTGAGISYRKTKRAETIPGFDQTPDFIIPDEFNPQIVIEAKITEDDGTARDKVTRIQHLGELSTADGADEPRFEVVACIEGRGFAVRRSDMRKLLIATRGKVFTLATMDRLVDFTRLSEFRTKSDCQ